MRVACCGFTLIWGRDKEEDDDIPEAIVVHEEDQVSIDLSQHTKNQVESKNRAGNSGGRTNVCSCSWVLPLVTFLIFLITAGATVGGLFAAGELDVGKISFASPTASGPSKSPSASPTTARPSKSPSASPTTSTPTTSPSSLFGTASKLVGTGYTGSRAYQGMSIALTPDGKTLATGGYGDNSQAGAIWAFNQTSGGTFAQSSAKLTALGSFQLGYSVLLSSDGMIMVSGAPGENSGAGRVRTFTLSQNVWIQYGLSIDAQGATTNAYFGKSCGGNADLTKMCCGGWGDSSGIGKIWCYTRALSVWDTFGTSFTSPSGGTWNNFGYFVVMSADGKWMVTGAPQENAAIGRSYVYDCSGTSCVNTQTINPIGYSGSPAFGQYAAIAPGGTVLAIAGWFQDMVWVYTLSGSTWGPATLVTAPISGANFGSGLAFSYDGSVMIIGGFAYASNQGLAWVFRGTALERTLEFENRLGADQHIGVSVATDYAGGTIMVGGYTDNNNIGAVWPFVRNTAVPTGSPIIRKTM